MTSIGNKVLIVCFLLIIFGLGAATVITPDREISEVENRQLAHRPDITKAGLVSGELFQRLDSYFTDQFYNRDWFIKKYTQEQILTGKVYVNDVVMADNDWLMFPPIDKNFSEEIKQSTNQLKSLADSFSGENREFYVALTPYKMNILEHKYPHFLNKNLGVENFRFFEKNLPDSITVINGYDQFKGNYTMQEIENFFFKTDHHWNIEGAFAGYYHLINQLGLRSDLFEGAAYERDQYVLRCKEDALFVGSLNNQIYKLGNAAEDRACQLVPEFESNLVSVRTKNWDGSESSDMKDIYGTGFEKEEVLYGDLYTWDLPLIKFEFKNTGNDLNVLVLKDSYGNPIQPFIAQHFKHTFILDLRHYKEESVEEFIRENDIDMVVFLYNDSNLFGEMYEVQ